MPSIIRVLDEQTINKIAAGEVIENPASVVKELVENAIDAGATDICIEIKGGGRQLIRVTDNGCGMNRDDALLCLERHATSKIKAVEDIHDISTMGFRGEAIPSIASISKFTLLTFPNDAPKDEKGTMLIVDGGRIVHCGEAVRNPGTTIEVKSLFFNVPVRKKFQKSPNYDVNEILKMISLIALGYPNIQFELISQQNTLLTTRKTSAECFIDSLKSRIKDVLGEEFLSGLIPVELEKEGYRVQGFIGQPFFNRHNRTGQYLFVNRRGIQSLFLSYCIKEGYGTTLSPNRHPVFVVHLEMPGSTVDVNVHPQKREVRVRQEQVLKALLIKTVEEALQSNAFACPSSAFPSMEIHTQDWLSPAPAMPPSFSAETHFTYSEKLPEPPIQIARPPEIMQPPSPLPHPVFLQKEEKKQKAPRVIGTIRSYILVDGTSIEPSQTGLLLVDQRAAHARVLFEQFCKTQSTAPLSLQSLLIPYTWEAASADAALIRESLPFFNELGIKIHEIGPCTFLVDALPSLFGSTDIQLLINDLLHRLRECHEDSRQQRLKEKGIALAASRAAVSHSKQLQLEEAQSLVNRLMLCESPFQCPQGQPTMASLTPDDLQKLFLKNSI